MKKIATIILNRNLPRVTDRLVKNIKQNNFIHNDIFVLESGSDEKNLSKYTTWHANWPSAQKKGLRFHKGMNYALFKLYKENKLGEAQETLANYYLADKILGWEPTINLEDYIKNLNL